MSSGGLVCWAAMGMSFFQGSRRWVYSGRTMLCGLGNGLCYNQPGRGQGLLGRQSWQLPILEEAAQSILRRATSECFGGDQVSQVRAPGGQLCCCALLLHPCPKKEIAPLRGINRRLGVARRQGRSAHTLHHHRRATLEVLASGRRHFFKMLARNES